MEFKLLGLIGYPLSHSFSQSYFRKKFSQNPALQNYDYLNFSIEHISQLHEIIINHPNLTGFNVTIPYKEQILEFLDHTDEIVREIKAVNTVKVLRKNNLEYKLTGYNTDVYGFEQSINLFLKAHHQKALILGSGGASKAVAYVFKKLGIKFLFVSRNPYHENSIAYDDVDEKIMKDYNIIVNTSPLGMFPNIDSAPSIPYQYINDQFLCFDLVYNPQKTKFLTYAEKQGAQIVNGYQMLVLQAEKAWEIFQK